MASEIGIFFLAGFETTGHSGAWLLYLVSQHPEVEAKICQEMDQHGLLVTAARPNPRQVTYDDLAKLTYLDMAIKVCLPPNADLSAVRSWLHVVTLPGLSAGYTSGRLGSCSAFMFAFMPFCSGRS